MISFRHKEDVVPVTIFTLLALADLVVFLTVRRWELLALWFALVIMPKVAICAWNHHHQHVPTFRSTFWNRILELIYTTHTGITTNAWVLHHNLGHHVNYLDQTKDESRWKRKDGSTMGELEYTVKLACTGYWTAYKVGRKHPKFQRGFLSMGTVSSALLVVAFLYNWKAALTVYALPMFIGYVMTCWHTYSHHAGLDTDDHFEASYNIMHKWYNIVTGNLGYHTAHHLKQAVHWSKLPDLHREIEHKIPKELYREPSIPLKWLPGK